ncbi:hypothetical protein EDD60_10716 [Longibaculum muris]|uniref:Uncharacterized protein n=1 Tax=Longibaculum muris TaxID=1796628 RepID=A0A4R3Z3U2_9FIRM|nr:hypothetical protein EDD60_10716 [Longibaculum muris]
MIVVNKTHTTRILFSYLFYSQKTYHDDMFFSK